MENAGPLVDRQSPKGTHRQVQTGTTFIFLGPRDRSLQSKNLMHIKFEIKNTLIKRMLYKPTVLLEAVFCKKRPKIVPDQLLVWGIRAL